MRGLRLRGGLPGGWAARLPAERELQRWCDAAVALPCLSVCAGTALAFEGSGLLGFGTDSRNAPGSAGSCIPTDTCRAGEDDCAEDVATALCISTGPGTHVSAPAAAVAVSLHTALHERPLVAEGPVVYQACECRSNFYGDGRTCTAWTRCVPGVSCESGTIRALLAGTSCVRCDGTARLSPCSKRLETNATQTRRPLRPLRATGRASRWPAARPASSLTPQARCGPTLPARPAPSAPSSLTSAPRAALSVSGQARAFLSILHQVKVSFLLLGGDGFFDEDRDPTTPCTVREEMPASPPRLT